MGAEISDRKSQRVLSEINVTPFVDVMLVLLVIFMITAPMLQQGLGIELPETKNTGLQVPDDPFIVVIKRDRKVYLGSEVVPMSKLKPKLKAIFKNRKSKAVYIRADKRVEYGLVAEALGEVQSAGLTQINLITKLK